MYRCVRKVTALPVIECACRRYGRAFASAVRLSIKCQVGQLALARPLRCVPLAERPTMPSREVKVNWVSTSSAMAANIHGVPRSVAHLLNLQILPEILRGHKISDVI